jgi:hypothetical protein
MSKNDASVRRGEKCFLLTSPFIEPGQQSAPVAAQRSAGQNQSNDGASMQYLKDSVAKERAARCYHLYGAGGRADGYPGGYLRRRHDNERSRDVSVRLFPTPATRIFPSDWSATAPKSALAGACANPPEPKLLSRAPSDRNRATPKAPWTTILPSACRTASATTTVLLPGTATTTVPPLPNVLHNCPSA